MEAAQILDRVVARFIGTKHERDDLGGRSAPCVFDSHVPKFSEVLIERGNWAIFGSCRRGDQAVHEMNLRPSISV
jgi:hypothetical protein